MAEGSRVILEDDLKEALIRQLALEGFMRGERGSRSNRRSRVPSAAALAESLAILVVFDGLVLPIWGGDAERDADISFPELEDGGVISRLPPQHPESIELYPPDERLDKQYAELLRLVLNYKPFVLNRMMANRPDTHERVMSLASGFSRRKMLSHLLDLVYGMMVVLGEDNYNVENNRNAEDDHRNLARNPLVVRLRENETFHVFIEYLAHFWADVSHGLPEGGFSFFRGEALIAGLFAKHVHYLASVSELQDAPVASRQFIRGRAGWRSLRDRTQNVPDKLGAFCLLRATLDEEGFPFPKIKTVGEALELRKDRRLRSYRSALKDLHASMQTRDAGAILQLRTDVRKARDRLHLASRIDRALKWVTYVSIPTTVAETLTYGIPALSSGFLVADVAGAATSDALRKKSEWMLIGQ